MGNIFFLSLQFFNRYTVLQMDISKQVLSPMPGLVKSVNCQVGDMVAEGQEVCVIG